MSTDSLDPSDKQEDRKEVSDNNKCVMCRRLATEWMCLPCGHVCLCVQCKDSDVRGYLHFCPVCRRPCNNMIQNKYANVSLETILCNMAAARHPRVEIGWDERHLQQQIQGIIAEDLGNTGGLVGLCLARDFVALVLTAKDPFCNGLLSRISCHSRQIMLNMLVGMRSAHSMAFYRSLRSELSSFNMRQIRNCSAHKAQALFVERYRQRLFDERYKGVRQPALARALSNEPQNLEEFQQQRRRKFRRLSDSNDVSTARDTPAMSDWCRRVVDPAGCRIKVKAEDGTETYFTIKKTTKLSKLMQLYCAHVGKGYASFRFLFDGDRIAPDSTPNDLDMTFEDQIDVMVEKHGGV